ncbi:MAG: pseudouridine synthase [Betaproteobacteria bacterium]
MDSKKTAAPAGGPQDREDAGRVRLNKRMADLGLCSRRQADAWIERGWVRVDGQEAQLGLLVSAHSRIDIDPRAREQQSREVTLLLNKPVGYVSAQAEDGYLPAVSLFKADRRWSACTSSVRWSAQQLRGLAPAGRLDIDSVGLLVLTQDGRLARHLIGEDSAVEKEYLVRVSYEGMTQGVQAIFPRHQLERLRHGLSLDGQALKPAEVSWQNPEQLRFVLREGRKRQIRRMCELVGLKVTGLKRIRIGGVLLGSLPLGQWRYLRNDESF